MRNKSVFLSVGKAQQAFQKVRTVGPANPGSCCEILLLQPGTSCALLEVRSLMNAHQIRLMIAIFLGLTLSYSGVAWAVLRCPMGGCGETSLQHHSDATHRGSPRVHCGGSYYNKSESFGPVFKELHSSEFIKSVQIGNSFAPSTSNAARLFWIRALLERSISPPFSNSPPRYLSLSVLRI